MQIINDDDMFSGQGTTHRNTKPKKLKINTIDEENEQHYLNITKSDVYISFDEKYSQNHQMSSEIMEKEDRNDDPLPFDEILKKINTNQKNNEEYYNSIMRLSEDEDYGHETHLSIA